MGIGQKIKDHILVGGPNALAGWGLLTLLMIGFSFDRGRLVANPLMFMLMSLAALCTGMGVYALNAYFDREADKINKPKRPIPGGRMTPGYVLKYSIVLMVSGMLLAIGMTVIFNSTLITIIWTIFTILGLAYSVPPLKFKSRHILGNLTFGLFGGIAYLLYIVFFPQILTIYGPTVILLQILLFTISLGGLITMKDFYDTEGDAAAGDITLPVKIGKVKAAFVSIIMMMIPVAFAVITSPPDSLLSFLDGNYWTIVYIASFTIYAVLEYVKPKSLFSDPYARVQYYFVILLAVYSMVIGASVTLPAFIDLIDRYLFVILYGIVASAAVYISYRRSGDVLKPTLSTTS